MRTRSMSRTWLLIVGVVLLAVGVLGFLPNPLVGADPNALVPTDPLHDIVHIGSGILALALGMGVVGDYADAAIGFGILYAVIFAAVLISPTLFGLFSVPANGVVHLLHAAIAGVSLGVGYMERRAAPVTAR